jgi:hypothetical protein
MSQAMRVAIRSSLAVELTGSEGYVSFVNPFAFAPLLPEFLAGVGLLTAFIGASRTSLLLPPGTGQSGYSGDTRPKYWNAADGFPSKA